MNGTAVMIHQNKLMRTFRKARALSASKARTLEELHLREGFLFRKLVGHGVFVQKGQAWYMDEFAAEAFVRRRRMFVLVALALGIVVISVVVLLATRQR